jgi:asparagine synthase (glutamine-hydrolysing)
MCGIAGSVHHPVPADKMMRALNHRGPDEQGYWQDEHVQLINTRLAIQELTPSGSQPMHLDNLVIVFNGEIYNHFELRKQFGLLCQSHSDTETLLHLFKLKGIAMLDDLDGMFVFCIYDKTSRQLWLARDRTGEKPLYYYYVGRELVFASELNAMRVGIKLSVDDQKISDFLAIGYLSGEHTPFQGVKQLPGGHYLTYNIPGNSLTINLWWSLIQSYEQPTFQGSLTDTINQTDQLLEKAVTQCLQSSDKEVGAFLSGGIDSGLICSYAAKKVKKLRTFTITFDGVYNEGPAAREVARHIGTVHEEIIIGLEELESDLEKIFQNYGEPVVDDSIIPSYYVAREAKKNLSVVLTGDGGDELFGGYRRYVPFSKIDFLSNRFRAAFSPLHNVLPFPRQKLNGYNYAYRLLGMMVKEWDEVYFAATIDLLHDYTREFTIKPDFKSYTSVIEPIARKEWNGLHKIMYLDNVMLLQNILLKKMDIATMAHSLESRAPFLSKDMLQWSPCVPEKFKVKGTKTKHILRELSKRYLPEKISTSPKRGFEIPLQQWVDNRLKKPIFDLISPDNAYVKTILAKDFVNSLLYKPSAFNPEKRAKALFALLSVEIWKRGL